MSEARHQILQMLQEGKISADQAMELLQAMRSVTERQPPIAEEAKKEEAAHLDEDAVLIGDIIQPPSLPDMDRYRRLWQVPFFIALSALLITGLGLRTIYQSSEGAVTFWFVCIWSLFLFTFLITVLAYMSRRAAWLHVRVNEDKGRRIAISLPLPLGIAGWALTIARGFSGDKEREKLDMAAGFLDAARENLKSPGSDPLIVRVDDDDGDQVEVYIG